MSDNEKLIRSHLKCVINDTEGKISQQADYVLRMFNEFTGFGINGLKGKVIREMVSNLKDTEVLKIARSIWQEKDRLRPEFQDYDFKMVYDYVNKRVSELQEEGNNE